MTTTVTVANGGQILCPPFGAPTELDPVPGDDQHSLDVPTPLESTPKVGPSVPTSDPSRENGEDEGHQEPSATSSTSTVIQKNSDPEIESDGMPIWVPLTLVLLLVALAIAVAVAIWALVTRGTKQAAHQQSPVVVPEPSIPISDLVPELITFADLATGPAAEAQSLRVMRMVGILRIDVPPNAVFDDTNHSAATTRSTPDTALHGHVAEVLRAGWRNSTGVVRPADVVVWVPPDLSQEK